MKLVKGSCMGSCRRTPDKDKGAKTGGIAMNYMIKYVDGHVEVYTAEGAFLFSADTRREAMQELEDTAS